MVHDLRQTFRALRHAPWYSSTVIGVIALGMALATTVFAVVVANELHAHQGKRQDLDCDPPVTIQGQLSARI